MNLPSLQALLENFHLQQPQWLWALLLLLIFVLVYWRRKKQKVMGGLEAYADLSLLPHLLLEGNGTAKTKSGRSLIYWSLGWILIVLALAGPRWDYTEVKVHQGRGGVLILLDLSNSMDAADVKPSRLERARQEIADLLNSAEYIRFGILAFAAVPHMVAPVTDDLSTLLNLLPALDTSLINIQGSNLNGALENMLKLTEQDPGATWDLLLISDGDIEIEPSDALWQQIGQRKIRFHTLGIGTPEGAPIPDPKQNWHRDREGKVVISKLNQKTLRHLASKGAGIYRQASYLSDDTKALLQQFQSHRETELRDRTIRLWEERFYVLLIPLAFLLLPLFRKKQVDFPAAGTGYKR